MCGAAPRTGFNPRVGRLPIATANAGLPGFDSVTSFNPRVGRLPIATTCGIQRGIALPGSRLVSIPVWGDFRLRHVADASAAACAACCFNPRVGRLPIATDDQGPVWPGSNGIARFNPRVGRLPIATRRGRRSDRARRPQVSIPVWGDFRLRPHPKNYGGSNETRFNPRVGRLPIATRHDGQRPGVGCAKQWRVSIPVWGDFRLRLRASGRLLSPTRNACFNPRVGRLPIATQELVNHLNTFIQEFQSPCGATSDCDGALNLAMLSAPPNSPFQSPCGATSDCDLDPPLLLDCPA